MSKLDSLIVYSESHNPYFNLALEEYLLSTIHERQILLYLWQNKDTIVIGSNQNPWKECNLGNVAEDGVKLARRISGGGAVFHDLGNLNFTFLADGSTFDVQRQTQVLLGAVKSLGFSPYFSGRNDLLISGRKFSGNAYYTQENASFHHGTLLINSDLQRIGRYLTPSNSKIASKGIDSVASRVMNLHDQNPDITIEAVQDALVSFFQEEYGPARFLAPYSQEQEHDRSLTDLYEKACSWKWIYAESPSFDFQFEKRFDWGEISFSLHLEDGTIMSAAVYSDTLLGSIIPKLKRALVGTQYSYPALQSSLQAISCTAEERILLEDVLSLLQEQVF